MEGVCDLFAGEEEENWQENLKISEYEGVKYYEQDSVIIGQSIWHGSKILSTWMMKNKDVF